MKRAAALCQHNVSLVFVFVLLTTTAVVINAQIPIPKRPEGFPFNPTIKGSSVVIDGFFDPLCPDCRSAWPELKAVLMTKSYSDQVNFLLHTFPLPYHRNSFLCSKAIHAIASKNQSLAFPYLESISDAQEEISLLESPSSVLDKLASLAQDSIPNLTKEDFMKLMADWHTELDTRVSFKASKAFFFSGTPTFFVNGVLPSTAGGLSRNKWERILASLLHDDIVGYVLAS
eukprot:jgi/Chlat1/6182/Chrsp42S05731